VLISSFVFVWMLMFFFHPRRLAEESASIFFVVSLINWTRCERERDRGKEKDDSKRKK